MLPPDGLRRGVGLYSPVSKQNHGAQAQANRHPEPCGEPGELQQN